jgi:limonene-1,2-epoxide hydrolase
MTASDAEAVVNEFIAAIGDKDIDRALEVVADDCYYDNVPIGDMTGKDAMRDFLAPMVRFDGPVEFQILRQTASGNVVMNERIDKLPTKSGRQIELPVAGVFEVNDGLITFWRDYFDNGMFMKQIKGE